VHGDDLRSLHQHLVVVRFRRLQLCGDGVARPGRSQGSEEKEGTGLKLFHQHYHRHDTASPGMFCFLSFINFNSKISIFVQYFFKKRRRLLQICIKSRAVDPDYLNPDPDPGF